MTRLYTGRRDAGADDDAASASRGEIAALRAEVELLRGAEARYREIAEQSSDLISRHSVDGVFLYASNASIALLGFQPEQLVGRRVLDLIHPDDQAEALRAFDDALAAGLPHVTVVCRLLRSDGGYAWVESTDRFIRGEAPDDVTMFHAVTRDITARKAAEDALRASEERYRTLADQSHDLISRHATNGMFTYASPASRALLGYEPEELVGHRPREFVHPDDIAGALSSLGAALTGAPATTIACRIRHKDGRYIWFESTDSVTRDNDGAISGFHSVTRDISERKATEDALRASEERSRQVFELARVGIAFVREDRRFLRVNRALCEMLEYEADELLSLTFLDMTHPDDFGVSDRSMEAIYRGQNDVGLEKRYITKSGRVIWARINASLMPGAVTPDGARYNLALIEDITNRKRAEEELRSVATLKSEFLALASHELRAPLTNINGGLEVMGDDVKSLPASSRRAMQIVSAEARRLTQLVESILDISRLDAGQLPLVLGPVAIEPLIARAVAGTDFEQRVDVWAAYGLAPVWADEVYLEHIVRNVLSNAAKYSAGRITVTVAADDLRASMSIVDHGGGIAAGEQSRIFEPFYRTERARGTADGYGLGLYFARRMLEAQGGSIAVRSPACDDAYAPGTAFDIALPIARKDS